MRILSLLPSATEILWYLGLGDQVVGVSHECDYPPEAGLRPRVVRTTVDPKRPSAEIDRQVRELMAAGKPLFFVDLETVRSLSPDLVVTQKVCEVCAVSPQHVMPLQEALPGVRVTWLQATTLQGVWEDVRRVAQAAGVPEAGEELSAALARHVQAVAELVSHLPRPRVACLEWLDPPFVAGHWVPEMVALAGGVDVLGEPGRPSWRTTWERVAEEDPDVVVLMPCGFSLEGTWARLVEVAKQPAFRSLRALEEGCVFAVDANAHFSRPGPRLVEGLRSLAGILHPECGFHPWARQVRRQDLVVSLTRGGV